MRRSVRPSGWSSYTKSDLCASYVRECIWTTAGAGSAAMLTIGDREGAAATRDDEVAESVESVRHSEREE